MFLYSSKLCQNLIQISLKHSNTSDISLRYLASSNYLKNLKELDLSYCLKITDVGIEWLSNSKNFSLNKFFASNVSIGDKSVHNIIKSDCFTNLSVLNLNGTWISEIAVKIICENLNYLCKLFVR